MKRVIIVLAVVMLFAMTASAQNQMKPAFYAGGGLSMPVGPELFSDYWKMGMAFGGGIGFELNPNLEIIGKFFFNTFPFDDEKFLSDLGVTGYTIDGLDFRSLEFGADVKYIFTTAEGAPFKPFFIVGAGMSNVKVTDVTVTGEGETIMVPMGDISETDFMLSGGAGFDYMFSPKAGLWVEARYATILTEGDATGYIPIRAGIKILFGN